DIDVRGRYGVSGGWDGTVRVWDLDRGTNLYAFVSDPVAGRCDVRSCAMSADGRRVVAASALIRLEPRREYSKVQVWDTRSGQTLVDIDYDTTERIGVAFAGIDQTVAAHTSGRIDINDIKGRIIGEFDVGEPITGGID